MRLSSLDVAVLLITMLGTWFWWPSIGPAAGIIPFAVGHFFLFCNVFRLHRRSELIWAGLAVVNVGIWSLLTSACCWPAILLCQLPFTSALILREMLQPRYHGVFAARINPRLTDYLSGSC